MRIHGAAEIGLHIYQLLLVKDDQVFDYAMIMETHHPDYLTTNDLHSLYEYDTTNALSPGEAEALADLMLGND